MAIGNTDAQKERLWQSARTSEVDAVRRRLDSGQHVALVVGDGKSGDGLGDPVIGRVLGEESGRLTSGLRRLGDVRLVVIDCGLYPQPLGALYEALRRVSELLGTGRSGSQVAADRVLAGLRRRLIGDVGEPPPHLALLLALEKLGPKAGVSGVRWALAFARAERADADTLHELTQLVARRLSVPLLLLFGSSPTAGPGFDLLAALRACGGDDAVIECVQAGHGESGDTAKPRSLPALSPPVMAVLRALALTGAGCELSLLVELLGLRDEEVLWALQEASDAGVEIIDDGNDHFELKPELVSLLISPMLPSLVRSYHRRLAALLSDRLPPTNVLASATSATKTASPSATTAVLDSLPVPTLGSADTPDIGTEDVPAATTQPGAAPDVTPDAPGPAPAGSEPAALANSAESEKDDPATQPRTTDREASTYSAASPALSQVLVASSEKTPAIPAAPDPAAAPAAMSATVPLYADAMAPTLHWPYGAGPAAARTSSVGQSAPTPAGESPPANTKTAAAQNTAVAQNTATAPASDRSVRRAQPARAARHLIEAGEIDPGIDRYLHAVDQALRVGAIREALTLADRAMQLLGELPDSPLRRTLRIRALCAVGRIRWLGNGPDERFTLKGALTAFQEARALLRPTDSAALRTTVVSQLSAVLYEIGDLPSLEAALTELSDASRTLLGQGEPAMAARLLNDQAAVYVRIGDPVRAAHLLEESRRFFSSGRFPSDDEEVARELADTEHLLAKLPLHVAARQGRQLDAIGLGRSHAQQAAETYKRLGMRRELAHVTETLGRLETMAGRHEAAMAYLSTAAELGRELHDLLLLARTTAAMSEVLVAANQLAEAIELLVESLSLNVEKGSLIGLAFVRRSVEKLAQRVKITESSEAPTSRALARLYEDLLAAEDQLGRAKLPSDG